MHTLRITLIGLILLSVFVFVAGYSVLTELAVHVVVFGVPAGVAWFLSRRFRARFIHDQPGQRHETEGLNVL